jgi:orotidine-5'-phosphate decarboxylase
MHFADDLIDAIREKGSPACVGIDPMLEMLPPELTGSTPADDARRVLDVYFKFVTDVLQIVAPLVPAVKFQSAYFEQYRHEGVEAYFALIREAKDLGLLVIGDAKRGDIGSTSAAYAAGHLHDFPADDEEFAAPDALTINPMLGIDSIEPFIKASDELGKGLFVLVRTSNPGSADFQDVKLADGRTWSELLADTLHDRVVMPRIGASGFASIGVVVGATQVHTIESMRKRLPNSVFLLPGYGTQGATAEMTRAAFDSRGLGAIVSASRSILYPKRAPGEDWRSAIERATLTMRDELAKVIAGRAGVL